MQVLNPSEEILGVKVQKNSLERMVMVLLHFKELIGALPLLLRSSDEFDEERALAFL